MTTSDATALDAFIRKLERLAKLGDVDRAALRRLPFTLRRLRSGEMLVREGDRTAHCFVLVDGFACRHKTTADGARQIVSFHVPGDALDLQHLLLPRADHNLQTISPATVAVLAVADLKALIDDRPRIREALWRDMLIDASIFREWVLNLGRRDARSRIAHLLCELAVKREAAGLGAPDQGALPLTQEQIADATGLTAVHVNRMLAVLGSEGLVSRDRRPVQIIDWPGMRIVAGFDPNYLHAAAA